MHDTSRVRNPTMWTDSPFVPKSRNHFVLTQTFAAFPHSRRLPVAFAPVVSYARCMELLSHDELVRLTPPERLTLISQLWDSLEDNHIPLTAAQRMELDRRLRTLDQDRRQGITWTALKAELEQRCP
jgi:putative addiction module component (TIGR02574 family)